MVTEKKQKYLTIEKDNLYGVLCITKRPNDAVIFEVALDWKRFDYHRIKDHHHIFRIVNFRIPSYHHRNSPQKTNQPIFLAKSIWSHNFHPDQDFYVKGMGIGKNKEFLKGGLERLFTVIPCTYLDLNKESKSSQEYDTSLLEEMIEKYRGRFELK